jgi:hypothetical protein
VGRVVGLGGRPMVQGRETSLSIRLTPADRQTLLAWQRARTIPAAQGRRGRIILLLAEGMSISQTARTVGINRHIVYKWVRRFLRAGVAGLTDSPRSRTRPAQTPRIMGEARACGVP